MRSAASDFSLFDIQVNGFAGIDFQRADLTGAEARRAVEALARHETRRFFVALISDEESGLVKKLERWERIRSEDAAVSEAACGYHLEGPWISSEAGFRGAHNARWLRAPDLEMFRRFQRAATGNIRLVTLAPELAGSGEFIRGLVDAGVRVSIGHSNASEGQIDEAIRAGARFCTHLGNGVPLELHRHENVVQRLLARDELTAFFIPDGIHLPPDVLKNFFRAKPAGKAVFTTDGMAGAGAAPGRYTLGELTLDAGEDGVVHFPGKKTFAGSTLTLNRGVKNVERWLGLSAAAARPLFSTAIAQLFDVDLPRLET